MKSLLVGCLCIIAWSSALATSYSTAKLKTNCDAYVIADAGGALNPDEIGFCIGYVIAFTETAQGTTVQDTGTISEFHWADGVSADQVIRVFLKYVNNHPEVLNKGAITSLILATGEVGLWTSTPVAKPIVAKEQ